MSKEKLNPLANLGIFRLETLEDGIFAIAMTLLVLNLKVPSKLNDSLIMAILQIWPSLVTFFGSFLLLGVFWFGHRAALDYIKHADHIFHWLNILLLMFVSILPFSASLIAKYYFEQTAVIIYGFNLILIGSTMYIQWVYATKNFRLIDKDIPVFVIKFAKLRIIFPPISYSIAILLSFIDLRISLIIYTIVPSLYILPFLQPVWRRFVKV
jgi:uncharacterized membrane protein